MNGVRPVEVNSCKYLGVTLFKDSKSVTDIRHSIATSTAVTARLDSLWDKIASRFIESTTCKITSYYTLYIVLYGCKRWALLAYM